jgi:hypothetical protein
MPAASIEQLILLQLDRSPQRKQRQCGLHSDQHHPGRATLFWPR